MYWLIKGYRVEKKIKDKSEKTCQGGYLIKIEKLIIENVKDRRTKNKEDAYLIYVN